MTRTDEEERLAHELARQLLLDAVLEQSSDIHLVPERTDGVVRYRIDGKLQEISRHPHRTLSSLLRALKHMARLDPDVTTSPQGGTLPIDALGRQYELRVGTMPTCYGESLTLRLTEPLGDAAVLRAGPAGLGFEGEDLRRLERMFTVPYGLTIVTGATGCGKTSTIYAGLAWLADQTQGHISIRTLEDPLERAIDGVIQTAVDAAGDFNYVQGIKAVLMNDLDALYCGEIPNAETARLLLQTALTGHRVISQLHAPDVAAALTRLRELVEQPYLIGMGLAGVAAQRLVRRLCPGCRITQQAPARWQDRLETDQIWGPGRCDKCRQTGYRGRTVVAETVPGDDETVCHAVSRGMATEDLRALLREQGYRSLEQHAMTLVADGVTSLEEAVRVAFTA
ncbi:MAG TPA: ATPase, T2SS/T4P/T4SS family [Candidatus Xenobia bacterium]|jgi:general secretion pathway protein E